MWQQEFFVYHLSNPAGLKIPQYMRKSNLKAFRPTMPGEFKEHPECHAVIELFDSPGLFLICESVESLMLQLQFTGRQS